MISFVVPFCTVEKDKFLNLNAGYDESDSSNVVFSTIKAIKSINSLKCDKEIILVDNSHTWPDIALPNVRVIKGWQAIPIEELKEFMFRFRLLEKVDTDPTRAFATDGHKIPITPHVGMFHLAL